MRQVFLPVALQRQVVGPATTQALATLADALAREATGRTPAPAPAPAAVPAGLVPSPGPAPGAPAVVLPPVPSGDGAWRTLPVPPSPAGSTARAAREPSAAARWWARTRESVGSDLATHGLAYLGVLLLFVGAFGLVAFAFGDVAEGARPVAELVLAAAPFAAAWLLLRRGALIAGRALELAGGLLLPIMVVTSFLDGATVPPDLVGAPLVVAMTTLTALVALGYAGWSARHPASALRFLVAPVAWLAVALATAGVGREIPSGRGVAEVTAYQVASVALAMLATLGWVRARPAGRLSRPTLTASVVGCVVVGALALLTWASGGWPVVPVAVTGVAGLLVLELLVGRLARGTVRLAQPLWWAVVVLALAPGLGLAAAALVAAVGFAGLVELEAHDAGARVPVLLSSVGLLVALLAVWAEPWWAVGAWAAVAVWTGVRRLRPYAVPHSSTVLDYAAGIAPAVAVLGLGLATGDPVLALAVGAVLVLLAGLAAVTRTEVLRRGPDDHFWTVWWDAAAVVELLGAVVVTSLYLPGTTPARWLLVAVVGLLTASAATGPLPPAARAWPVLAGATWAWLLASWVAGLGAVAVATAVAVVALGIVVWVHARPTACARWASPGSLAAAGLALGAAAVAVGGVLAGAVASWAVVVPLALLTAALLVATAYGAASPVLRSLHALGLPGAGYVLPGLAVVALPVTVALGLDVAGAVALGTPWSCAVPAVVALGYAATTRLLPEGADRAVLVWASLAAALVAVVPAEADATGVVALGSLIASVLVLPSTLRPRAHAWLAWAAVAPWTALLVAPAWPWYDRLDTALALALTLVAVGGGLLVGAAGADLRGRPWRPVLLPTHPTLLPPAALGAVEVVVGVVVSFAVATGTWLGSLLLMAAAVVLGTAVLSRAWARLTPSLLLVWAAVWPLAGDYLEHAAWLWLLVTVLLLGAAEAGHRLVADRRWWARADLPPLVVAHLTALTALLTSGGGTDSLTRTLAGVGVLAVVLAARLRRHVVAVACYATLGALLLLLAGALAGPGWLALVLAAYAVATSVLALALSGPERWLVTVVGALMGLGAWVSLTQWLDLSPADAVDGTVALGAGVALGCAVAVRWTRADRGVAVCRGALGLVTAALAPVVTAVLDGRGDLVDLLSWWTAGALLASAVAVGLVAAPLGRGMLRHAAVLLALLAETEALAVLQPGSSAWQWAFGVTALAAAAVTLPPVVARGPWARPALLAAWVSSFAAVALALSVLSDAGADARDLPAALLVTTVVCVATAVVLGSLWPRLVAALLACGAWLAWAGEALAGNPQWFTVPIGLTLLVVVGVWRQWLRQHERDAGPPEVVLVELVGIGFVVGAAFVQAFTDSLAYAAVAAALGALVALWGVLTRVRRRLVAGTVVVVAALLVLVAVPLAQLVPAWTSAMLWIAIAAIGLVALLSATLLEQGRAVVRRSVAGLRDLTAGWE